MLKQSNSILQLCIIVVVVMLLQLSPVLSQDVKIGTQVWTSKNLDVSTFRNGDPIPEARNQEQWQFASENKIPAWCYSDYDERNGKKYGKFYNWFAVSDSRGLAPQGYHIPSDAEWTTLTDFLGGSDIAGKKMKSKDGWQYNGNGDNSSRFNGLPSGCCAYDGSFDLGFGVYGAFWGSSEDNTSVGCSRYLTDNYDNVFRSCINENAGFSVRCIKD